MVMNNLIKATQILYSFSLRRWKPALLGFLFLCLGVMSAKAQRTDYSGYYYISNYNTAYYVVPAANSNLTPPNPPKDVYYDAYDDPRPSEYKKPFLTTYTTNKDCNSIWYVTSAGDDCYYIQHWLTKKYVVYGIVPGFTGDDARRKNIHLEDNNPQNESSKFSIGEFGTGYVKIKPISVGDQDLIWNPAKGNTNTYYGQTSPGYYKGLVSGAPSIYNNAVDNACKWKLNDAPVLPPVISFDNVTNQVTITCETEGAEIRYTTDGTDPTASSTLYSGPFVQNSPCTIKAIAIKEGNNSPVYTFTLEQVAPPPIFQVEENNTIITISTTTEGATIHFTCDNSIPSAVSPVYTVPLDFHYSGLHIKAIAVKNNMLNSDAASPVPPVPDPIILKCPQPEIYPDFETNLVYLFCDADAASIYYTIDGTEPTTSSTLYNGTPFSLPASGTVKAIATGVPNCYNSNVATYTIAVVDKPDVHLNAGHNNIAITTATVGADIYYTIDGSNPTTRSIRYTGPFREGPNHERVSNVEIKAIAVKSDMFWSNIGSRTVMLTCEPPLINRIGNNSFSISSVFPETNVSIYYTLNGDAPTPSSTLYSGPFSYSGSLPFTIKAIAVADNYDGSEIAAVTYSSTNDLEGEGTDSNPYLIRDDYDYTLFVNKANTNAGSSKHYKLVANISAAGTSEVTTTFTGIFEGSADADGNFYRISDLTHPMFKKVQGGVVRNVIVDNVLIQFAAGTERSAGAIASDATQGACIYNCGVLSGKVGGSKSTGGIVGYLEGYSSTPTRVLNCFSFAEITSGTWVSGIVGQNYTSSSDGIQSIVMNCLFYGEISGGNDKAPVYGRTLIKNTNLYDYFLESASFDDAFTETKHYYRSWPVEERFLNRFGYYRSILNSNRRLCAWWVTQRQYDDQTEEDLNLIAKWVLDPSIAPYPILKKWEKYPSLINPDPNKVLNEDNVLISREAALPYQGKSLGTLNVTVKPGSHASTGVQSTYGEDGRTIQLTITDMDTLHYDYGYYKVQLPYYNELFGNVNSSDHDVRYGGNYKDWVVTGWKITAVTGGTQGTFVADWENGYNFADRECTDKDLYSVSGRVFAQGGYYYG